MKKGFEIIEHTADAGIRAYGSDIKEVFANTARGLFSLITELDDVGEAEYRDIELTAPDEENLLVEWLNELIYLFDAENMLFKRFEISEIDKTKLKVRSYGERVDSSRHQLKTGVKAATYHMLKIERGDVCKAEVLFDI